VNITSDKAYENKEWVWGYRESDPMGGYDPYSASKGCADLVATSYRNSYFNLQEYQKTHHTLLATCRAGNVIGGGDWAEDRLISDMVRSIMNATKVRIRNPHATRPWQHVLEPLSGYLHVGQKLLENEVAFGDAWNFGPKDEDSMTVEDVVKKVKKHWTALDYEINQDPNQHHEANLLKLDCSKAHTLLKWKDVWDSDTTFEKTVMWYKAYYEENQTILTSQDLKNYVSDATQKGLIWAIS
jgi:CDP-glucose 4,6-dehydratase